MPKVEKIDRIKIAFNAAEIDDMYGHRQVMITLPNDIVLEFSVEV